MGETLQFVTANISGSKPRKVQDSGRTYWVGNAVALREQILAGSQGPLFYKAADNVANTKVWLKTPVCVDHPRDSQGREISINDDPTKVHRIVGEVRVANGSKDGQLKFEVWIDEAKGFKSDKELTRNGRPTWFSKYLNGERIEVSTGLYTENEPAPLHSTHNGQSYTHFAKKHKPDHFAILPDARGACSVADGCGLNVNASTFHPEEQCPVKSGCYNGGAGCARCIKDNQQTSNKGVSVMERSAIVQWLTTNCECWKGKQALLDNTEAFTDDDLTKLKANEEKLSKLTTNEVCPGCGKDMTECSCAPAKTPAANDAGAVARVLANSTPTTTPRQLSMKEWEASMPAEARAVWNSVKAKEQSDREDVVKRLISNVSNKDRKVELAKKYLDHSKYSLDDLKDMVSLLPTANTWQQEEPVTNGGFATDSSIPLYHGASGGAPTVNDRQEILLNEDPFEVVNNGWRESLIKRRKELLRDRA